MNEACTKVIAKRKFNYMSPKKVNRIDYIVSFCVSDDMIALEYYL